MNEFLDRITEPLLMQSYATLFFGVLSCLIIILSMILASPSWRYRWGVFRAHILASSRGSAACDLHSILVLIPIPSFGFIPLSWFLSWNAEQLMLLILSAPCIFCQFSPKTWGMTCRQERGYLHPLPKHDRNFVFKVWLDSLGIPGVDSCLYFPFGILFNLCHGGCGQLF